MHARILIMLWGGGGGVGGGGKEGGKSCRHGPVDKVPPTKDKL